MPKFLAAFYCDLEVEDQVAAQLAAFDLEERIKEWLDDGESVEASAVVPDGEPLTKFDEVQWLYQARNILVRTRTKDGFDLARELDRAAHAFRVRLGVEESMSSYDWSKFMKVVEEISNGGNPL